MKWHRGTLNAVSHWRTQVDAIKTWLQWQDPLAEMRDCSTSGEQRTNRQGTDNLEGCDIILCGILIVDIHCWPLSKPQWHAQYQEEAYWQLGVLVPSIWYISIGSLTATNGTLWAVTVEERLGTYGGPEDILEVSQLSVQSCCELKTALENKV